MAAVRTLFVCAGALAVSGCIASTAADIVTAPVRAGAQVVDWTTTSQDEADRALGRRVRAREAEIGRLERRRAARAEACRGANIIEACRDAVRLGEEIADLRAAPL